MKWADSVEPFARGTEHGIAGQGGRRCMPQLAADELQELVTVSASERRRIGAEYRGEEALLQPALHARTFFARAALRSSEMRDVSACRTDDPSEVIR